MSDAREHAVSEISGPRVRRMVVISAVAAHIGLIQWLLPWSEVINDRPLTNYDHPLHHRRSLDRVRYIQEGGVIWGYSPRLMAGYVDGILPLDDGLTHWLNYGLGGSRTSHRVYKAWVLATVFLPPFLMAAAVTLAGFRREWPVALALTVVLLHTNLPIRSYYLFGMGLFVFANFVGLFSMAAFGAWCRSGRIRYFVPAVATLSVSFLIHPLALFVQLPGYAVLFLSTCRNWSPRQWGLLPVLLTLPVLVNWNWISVYLAFRSFEVGALTATYFRTHPGAFLRDLLFDLPAIPTVWITVAGLAGLSVLRQRSQHSLAVRVGTVQVCCLWLLGYLGTQLGFGFVQPYRFHVSVAIFLIPPAAFALCQAALWMNERFGVRPQHILAIGVCVAPALGYHVVRSFQERRIVATTTQPARLTTDMGRELEWMIGWLREHCDPQARAAIQELGQEPPVYRSHFMPMVAELSQREIIGNYHYKAFTVYGHAAVDELFLGVPFGELTSDSFLQLCELYNIHVVILHDEVGKQCLRTLESVRSVARFGRLEAFEVAIRASWVLEGNARVAADLNRIEVQGCSEPTTVLKYHYFPLLKTEPPLPLERHPVPGDPVGFIRVRNGSTRQFRIVTDYDRSVWGVRP